MGRYSRRRFLAGSSAAGFGVWVGGLPAFGQGRSPGEKLNVAVIGVGNRGRDNLNEVKSQNVVAICDVDERFLEAGLKIAPGAKKYADWRVMLDQLHREIDAVVVATPDHSHAHATLAAIAMGKHVYCEKPLTHSIAECRAVQAAAKRSKVATQLGTQIHALDNYRRVVELIQSGTIGKVSRVHVWVGSVWTGGGDRPPGSDPAPSHLNWDLWLGPAPERPFKQSIYHDRRWRGWWDFGGGGLADMACHHVDLSHWALGIRHPRTVEARGPEVNSESAPQWLIVEYQYEGHGEQPPVHLTWYHGGKRPELLEGRADIQRWRGGGSLFIGEKGMLLADYNKHLLLPEEQFTEYKRPEQTIEKSIGHHNEWIRACKERTPTMCGFEYGGPLTQVPLLGNISYRTGKKIEWDAEKGAVVNAPEAARLMSREYRKGWDLAV